MKKIILLLVVTSIKIFVANAQTINNVYWSTLSGITENVDVISNTSTSEGYCISDNKSSGESGYLEFRNWQNDKTKSIGLIITGNTGAIDHCFKFVNNTVSVYNGATLKVAAFSFSKGDNFKIDVTSASGSSTISFYHNGTLKTSYSVAIAALKIKVILTTQNSSFSSIKTSFGRPYSLSMPSTNNYVLTISPIKAASSILSSGEQRTTGNYLETVAYYDGLGRSLQTVHVAQSPMLRDIVQPKYYNNLGQQKREYLPYTVKTSLSGNYQSSALNTTTGDPDDQKTFMDSYYPNNSEGQFAYFETTYEESPLNRVLEKVGPGADWQGKLSDATKKSVKYYYGSNAAKIMLIKVNETATPVKYYLESSYAAGSLFLTTIIDENGYKSEIYNNKEGKIILKRSYSGSSILSTYYVYDSFGLLRLIVQPKGAKSLETSFSTLGTGQYEIPENILNTNCFMYEFDGKKRMTAKVIPGQTVRLSGESRGGTFLVYNNRDQVILTQDGNLASQNKWRFTKYDIYGRPILTGIYSPGSAITPVTMQSNADNSTLNQYEARSISATYGYTTDQSYPNTNLDIETVTCYDDYNYPGITYAYTTKSGFTNAPTNKVDGKITAIKVKVLGTSTWLTTTTYYDEYGRIIQIKKNNILSGNDIVTNEYTFTNNISKVLTENTVTLSGEAKSYALQKRFVYDHADRLIDAYEKVNSEAEVQLSRLNINETGLIKEKSVHTTSNKPPLQSIDYTYNVRGWLTGINNTNLDDGEGDIFGLKLMYNDLGQYTLGTKQYNGNIAAMEWYGTWTNPTNISDKYTGKHAYTYRYDGVNRILNSLYYANSSRNTGFDCFVTYDDNGNIKTMQQSATGYGKIDNLTYSYDNSELDNKLRAVGDAAIDNTNRSDFSEIAAYDGTANKEFSYDNNGNMLEDKNRNIIIQYNALDLPSLVTVGSNTISYVYDATGSRLKKTVNIAGTIINTYYIGEFVYTDNDISYALTSEGRIVKDGTTHRYEYFMKDHLGNTRMVFTDLGANGTVDKVQEDSYYPFGLKMPGFTSLNAGYSGNKLQYNGYETQDDIAGFGFIDYGARQMDPALGKWQSIDLLAEYYNSWSPYNYVRGNPINKIDLGGLGDYPIDEVIIRYNNNVGIRINPAFSSPLQPLQSYIVPALPNNLNFNMSLSYNQRFITQTGNGANTEGEDGDNNNNNIWDNWQVPMLPPVDVQQAGISEHLIGPALILSGQPWILKSSEFAKAIFPRSNVALQASKRTSLVSLLFRRISRKLGLSFIGGTAAKFVPAAGWAWTLYDVVDLTVGWNKVLAPTPLDQWEPNRAVFSDGTIIYVCFRAGTSIYSKEGFKPIDKIVVGDSIYSFNIEKNIIELCKVVKSFERNTQEIYELNTNNQKIFVTAEHPFYVYGRGWVKVKDLQVDSQLKTKDGSIEHVTNIILRKYPEKVYNIEVEGNHNYFVTGSGILVHNK